MKILLSILALVFSLSAAAQIERPGKIRLHSGFFTNTYEIGDKNATATEIQLHLEKHSPNASFEWKRANSLAVQSFVWSMVGLGGSILGLAGKSNDAKLMGWGAAAVGLGLGGGMLIGASAKYDKAISTYNRQFGY